MTQDCHSLLSGDLFLKHAGEVHKNLMAPALYEHAIRAKEGRLSAQGAFVVETGIHTGRSPKDKFAVQVGDAAQSVWWDNTQPMDPTHFEQLYADMAAHTENKKLYVQDLFAGANRKQQVKTRVITEFAWHSLFIRNLLIRPEIQELQAFFPDFLIVDLPSFSADREKHGARTETIIACDFNRSIVLIGGTSYAGEIKKSVFSILNYLLPRKDILPMHCSVSIGVEKKNPAVFFGLSGTGKTTLSADPARILLGDDEHGWSEDGLFNFEGGCYAKMINLSAEAEPKIFAATRRFGCVLENVVMDAETREPDLFDASLAENSRGAYPLHFIENVELSGVTTHPKHIILLTADAFGVLPPVAKLTPEQAVYHFISGYTAKVAGTEKGVKEPEAVFSTCFGAPFMSLHPSVYGGLLRDLVTKHNVPCFLLNTGWCGGPYGVGKRISIQDTRKLLHAILEDELDEANMETFPLFGFKIPTQMQGVDAKVLQPSLSWEDARAYDHALNHLASLFVKNFEKFKDHVHDDIFAAGPHASVEA